MRNNRLASPEISTNTAHPRLTAQHKKEKIDLNRPEVRHQTCRRLAVFQGRRKRQHAVYG